MKGRYLFRSAVRRVLEYIEWITEIPIIEEISDDVTINIKMAQQRQRVEKKLLTLEVLDEAYMCARLNKNIKKISELCNAHK